MTFSGSPGGSVRTRTQGSWLRPGVCLHASADVLAILEITTLGEAGKMAPLSPPLSSPSELPALGLEPTASPLGGAEGAPSQGGERTKGKPWLCFCAPHPQGLLGHEVAQHVALSKDQVHRK